MHNNLSFSSSVHFTSQISLLQIEEIQTNDSLLRKYYDSGIIYTAEAAELANMIFTKKERLVLQVHQNKISQRKDGKHREDYCYTNIVTQSGSKKISGSYADVISKLYTFYYGTEDDLSNLCFEDIRNDYETWYAIGRQPATIMVDKKAYRHLAGSKLSKIPISRMTYQDIKGFFINFSKEHSGEYSKSLFNKLRSCIYNMLEYALDTGIITSRIEKYHYTKAIVVCFAQNSRRDTWTSEEYNKLIRFLETQNDVFSLLFEYQLLTGDRFETISALRVPDIDIEGLKVHIHAHNTLSPVGSKKSYTVKEGTKGNGQNARRWMVITPFTLDVLKKAMMLDRDSNLVFSYNGRSVVYSTYNRRVNAICKEAGVTYHNPHSARSYIASKLNTGDNISQMCDYFGWSDKKMALRYNRNIDRETAEIRQRLELITSVHQSAPANPLSKFHKEKAANA